MTSATDKAKRLLPLYDDSAAIACTIGDAEIADRVAILERMRAAMTSIERTDTGLLLRFPRREDLEDDVRRFALDEKRCCQFWGFAVIEGDDDLVLRWDGPPAAGDLLDRFHATLGSDGPIAILRDLL